MWGALGTEIAIGGSPTELAHVEDGTARRAEHADPVGGGRVITHPAACGRPRTEVGGARSGITATAMRPIGTGMTIGAAVATIVANVAPILAKTIVLVVNRG